LKNIKLFGKLPNLGASQKHGYALSEELAVSPRSRIGGIWQKSPIDESNGDVSLVIAWRFWRKFLAMGSTGAGAALGRFSEK
jgi:hypothetical protein